MFDRSIALAAALALCAVPTRAGSVTYDFIDLAPNTGEVGAIMTIASPPASPDSAWSTTNSADILSFQLTNQFSFGAGAYSPIITSSVGSSTGTTLDSGLFTGTQGIYNLLVVLTGAENDSTINVSFQQGGSGDNIGATGQWVLAPTAVPEPSSLAMAAIAAVVGVSAWARRRLTARPGSRS